MNRIRIYAKGALDEWQIKSRKVVNQKLLGFEIHTNIFENNWSKSKDMREVITLHAPFEGFNHEMSGFFRNYRGAEWSDFIKEAKRINGGKGAGIVIHSNTTYDDFVSLASDDFLGFIGESGAIFHIENTMNASTSGIGVKKFGTSLDIPEICEYVNNRLRNKVFFPLLDICHIMADNQSIIDEPVWSIREYIRGYASDKYVIHLSSAIGDGLDGCGYHGVTFEGSPNLLDEILIEISELKSDVNIVIEVNEIGHTQGLIPENYSKILEEIRESCLRTGVKIEGL